MLLGEQSQESLQTEQSQTYFKQNKVRFTSNKTKSELLQREQSLTYFKQNKVKTYFKQNISQDLLQTEHKSRLTSNRT